MKQLMISVWLAVVIVVLIPLFFEVSNPSSKQPVLNYTLPINMNWVDLLPITIGFLRTRP